MIKRSSILFAVLLLFGAVAHAQQYYRWVDSKGTVHFSENPPPSNTKATKEQVKKTYLTEGPQNQDAAKPDDKASDNTDTTTKPTPPADQQPGSTTDAEMCRKIRANIQTLQNTPRVRRVDPNTGEVRMMTEQEHQEELKRTQAMAAKYC